MHKISVYSYVLFGEFYNLPYKQMIESVSSFDEIVVVTDKRFEDGTYGQLLMLRNRFPNLKICPTELDLNDPNIDGKTKEFARKLCSLESDFLLQMDADEILHPKDIELVYNLCKDMDKKNINIVKTGVLNFFNGNYIKLNSAGNVKERISRNIKNIHHGIPVKDRIPYYGYYRCDQGDGAGYIDSFGFSLSGELLDAINPFNKKSYNENIFIFHYSWYDLIRKWNMKSTWHYFWGILRGKYKNLADYKINLDGEPVDFWNPKIDHINNENKKSIIDELKDRSIVPLPKYIKHPEFMEGWLSNAEVYVPFWIKPKLYLNSIFKNKAKYYK